MIIYYHIYLFLASSIDFFLKFDVWVFNLIFKIAFDKNLGLEFFCFSFEYLYYKKYPNIRKINKDSSPLLNLTFSEFNSKLDVNVKKF